MNLTRLFSESLNDIIVSYCGRNQFHKLTEDFRKILLLHVLVPAACDLYAQAQVLNNDLIENIYKKHSLD